MSPELAVIAPDWPAPPGVRAFTTTRQGGVSDAPFDSFNLGTHVGDREEAVAANRARLGASLRNARQWAWLDQVHGIGVVEAHRAKDTPAADASWTCARDVACVILTADCLPVLLCSTGGDYVAAVHAGWRGLLAGVLEATLAAAPIDNRQLLAWLGPAIGPSAFEVGEEVRAGFLDAAAGGARQVVDGCFRPVAYRPGHYLADLYGLARQRLSAAGVQQVYGGHWCTYSDPGSFYSYRRDGRTGRMASLILRL